MPEKSHEETCKVKFDLNEANTDTGTNTDTNNIDTDTNAQSYRITNQEFVFSLFSNSFMIFFSAVERQKA